MKINNIIMLLVALIILNTALLLAVNILDSTEIENPINEISGSMKIYEIKHEGQYLPKHLTIVINKRFNDKFFEYLESKQESRRTTFFR